MHKIYVLSLVFTLFFSVSTAQNYTISGYVRDDDTGEDLIGATIYLQEIEKGTITNTYGFYSITVPAGTYHLQASFLGYADEKLEIILNQNIKHNFRLKETTITTGEVVVKADRTDNLKSSQMGNVSLPVKAIKPIPAFMGEVDILKTIQLLPGVQSGGEGNTGFYVRGGGPDQNLILLDEAVVYNASHLFGFFSVFNADAVNHINLIKGGMPANYGGRLSSVLDISMKEGNNRHFEADGGIGLIASRLTVQGPIVEDKSSFIVSGRRTYIDVLVDPFIKPTSNYKGSGYYFYDVNAKVNYRFSDKDRLYLSGYFGRDVFTFRQTDSDFNVSIPWGNATASLRWNHLFSDKLFVNTTAIFSDYQFEFEAEQTDFAMNLFSGIRDFNLKTDFNWLPAYKHNVKFGANLAYHIFTPSSVSARIGENVFDAGSIAKENALDLAVYLNEEWEISNDLKINVGIRGTIFRQLGPFTRFILDDYGQKQDSIVYAKNEKVVQYQNVEPRFSMRYSINDLSSLKASYTQNYQYIHLASLSSVSLPTDLWIPSSTVVAPQFGQQYAVGYFRNFFDDIYETSVELYYKKMNNQIEYAEGAVPGENVGDNADNSFTFGDGQSYGVELFLKKRMGRTTGWIGYTWSKTTRLFPEINNGEVYPAKYDRRHDFSFTATHSLNEQWTFSAVWIYATGNSLTLPLSLYFIEGQILNEYAPRNSYRMTPYHRADLSLTYQVPTKKRFESSWNFSVYNLYNRKNPYFIYFETDGNLQEGTLETRAKQVSLFPILPSITWNFNF